MTGQPFADQVPELLVTHFQALHLGSGLSIDLIRERGYRSVLGKRDLQELGFTPVQQRPPGLLLPIWTPDGFHRSASYRPDFPRVDARGKELRYELPKGTTARLDVPPRCRAWLPDPSIPLWLTEGQKKADALAAQGLCAMALLGVWNFKGRNEFGGVALLADFDSVAWNGREVYLVFDSDVVTKRPVKEALARITEILSRKGAKVSPVYLPPGEEGQKVGVDDYLLTHSREELKSLIGEPAPTPTAAPPQIELLDAPPPELKRPLQLIDGHAYAVTWLWVKTTVHEEVLAGELVTYDPPRVQAVPTLFVVRDDGVVFGPSETPLAELGIQVRLPDPPHSRHLWRSAGVKAYRHGARPDPAEVFDHLVAVYDRFMDFDRSLASQRMMCELSALFSLLTWLADAFTVVGYAWPNGERGSGKTIWGHCWALTSYLGEIILASGTFAAVRDLADMGAALVFDDAEKLADPKATDPAKRELLLAGNRKGVEIPLKEPGPDRTWQTRWVNAYGPRAFTAIALPDPVLASRVIAIPLVRTDDPARGNADPQDEAMWPCDRLGLQDDLWALALWLLPEAQAIWQELSCETSVVGREFEPWRGLLAVARLLERHGVEGLEPRLRQVMRAYQAEREELFGDDWTCQVIHAMLTLAGISTESSDTLDTSDASDTWKETCAFSASEIVEAIAGTIAPDPKGEFGWVTPTRIGKLVGRLRLERDRAPDKQRKRSWLTTRGQLVKLGRSYGLLARPTPPDPPPPPDAGSMSSDVSTPTPPVSSVRRVRSVQRVRSEEPSARDWWAELGLVWDEEPTNSPQPTTAQEPLAPPRPSYPATSVRPPKDDPATEGLRHRLSEWVLAHGAPVLELHTGESIGVGSGDWAYFLTTATAEQVRAATQAAGLEVAE